MASVPIYASGDRQKMRDLRVDVEVAENHLSKCIEQARDRPRRLGDDDPDSVRLAREAVDAAKAAYDAFVGEAADRADEWEVAAIGWEAWVDLIEAHPPRTETKGEGDDAEVVTVPEDRYHRVNTKTFGKALLLFVDPEDPEHRTVTKADVDLARLGPRLKRLPKGEFDTLWMVAYEQNVELISDPKASRYGIGTSSAESST